MINRVILVGNMTKDSESVSTSGKALTKLRLATNSVWRDGDGNRQESSEFHSVVTFGRLAEICAEYCTRGRRVYVEGRLRTHEYTGQDGLRRYSTEIVAETVKLLQPRPVSAGAGADTLEELPAAS
ncbi:MAG: single-stranded DNA-binding protein [Candidatus Dormibacteria bacterium]